MNETKLTPPVTNFYHKLKAFLEKDTDYAVEMNYDDSRIIINVANPVKGAALREILPETKLMGNITVYIDVNYEHCVNIDVFLAAFKEHPLFSKVRYGEITQLWYAYFKPEVVQYANDNFSSPEGLETKVSDELFRELFDVGRLCTCVEPIEDTIYADN